MLNPTNDRLDYGAILTPPSGYDLDFAVGTTYSLDLDALVGACLSLGLSESTDSELLNNPICLLEALRATGDNIAMFCESGQIHLPTTPSSLYILLEKVVFSVGTPKRKGIAYYPSFHPKCWLIRYMAEDGSPLYRFVVLSRNLTFDRSWDVSFYMDGTVSEEETEKNEPLADFLRYLSRQLPKGNNAKMKAKRIRALAAELARVKFVPVEKAFYDYEFLPTGIENSAGGHYDIRNSDLFQDTYHEILIMSPFLTGSVLRDFNNRNEKTGLRGERYVLFTRENSLSKLSPEDVSNFELYVMREKVVDGESLISEDDSNTQTQDIHAKMYLTRKGADTSLYLGSLNASHNAIAGNVEFMLRLKSMNRYLNVGKMVESLFGGAIDNEDNPFQKIALDKVLKTEVEDPTNELAQMIKTITRCHPRAEAFAEEEKYGLRLRFDGCDKKGYEITVRPLLSLWTEPFSEEIVFHNLSNLTLSEFYVLTVSNGEETVERVILIPTSNLPNDRESSVVNKIISDKQSFYRYIAFLLGDDAILSALEGDALAGDVKGNTFSTIAREPALYEKMLKTAANDPSRFQGIDYLLKTITDEEVIPKEFKKLYETFKGAVN